MKKRLLIIGMPYSFSIHSHSFTSFSADEKWANDFSPFKVKRKPAVKKTERDVLPAQTAQEDKRAEPEEAEETMETEEEEAPPAPKRPSPHETKVSFPQQTGRAAPVSQNVQQQSDGSNFNAPRFGQNIRRGSAGGVMRQKPVAKQATPAAPKKQTASSGGFKLPAKASNNAPPKIENIPSSGLKNQGEMRMFDDDTAKQVMNFTPEAENFNKLSPAQQKEMLNNIVDEQLKADKASEERRKNTTFKNIKDNPYGKK